MLKNKKKNQIIGPIIISGVVLIVGLAFIFLNTRPEYQKVVSDDGGMTVSGDFPANFDLTVQIDKGASQNSWTAAVERIYTIGPDSAILPTLVSLRMPTKQRDIDTTYSIGFFDSVRSLWVPVDTRRDDELGYFEAGTNHFSNWTLLKTPAVSIGEVDRDAIHLDALDGMPPGTQQYDVDLAYATVEGDFVLLEESAFVGRCQDTKTVQGRDVLTSTDREVILSIDGLESKGYIRALVRWTVGSGCSELLESSTRQSGFLVL